MSVHKGVVGRSPRTATSTTDAQTYPVLNQRQLAVHSETDKTDRTLMHSRADPGDSGSLGRNEPQPAAASSSELLGPGAVAAARWRRKPDDRLKRAVRRVLIALSFKSNKGPSRLTERATKQQLQQQQQQLPLSSWQLIPGTSVPPASYWDPVRYLSTYTVVTY